LRDDSIIECSVEECKGVEDFFGKFSAGVAKPRNAFYNELMENKPMMGRPPLPAAITDEVVRLLESGETPKHVAWRTGVSLAKVYQLRRYKAKTPAEAGAGDRADEPRGSEHTTGEN
jgi:hypothetical protein